MTIVMAAAFAVVIVDPLGVGSDETAASWRSDADPEDLERLDDLLPGGPADDPGGRTTTAPSTAPPPTTAPPTRLAPPPVAPAESGPHAFVGLEDDGDPITWDPCEPIRYVVNERTAPAGGRELLNEGLDAVSAATGLVFEDLGATDEVPDVKKRPLRNPARYGKDWSPVLIAWTDPVEVPVLEDFIGLAGPNWVHEGGGEYESVTGMVLLDGPELGEMLEDDWRAGVLHVILHELGHLIGLNHVDDPSQVMYHNRDSRGETAASWNTGDLAGLAILGNGPCNPDI